MLAAEGYLFSFLGLRIISNCSHTGFHKSAPPSSFSFGVNRSFTNMFGRAFFRCAAASFQERIRQGWQREVFWEWSEDESWEDCKIWKGRTWLKDVCVNTLACKQPTYNITKAHAQLTHNLIRPDYPGFGF